MNLILRLLFICSWAQFGISLHKKGYTAGKPIVTCNSTTMVIEIKADHKTDAFVNGFAKVKECQATRTEHLLKLELPLKGEEHQCGIQKFKEITSDDHIYYTKLTVRRIKKYGVKENIQNVHCKVTKNHLRLRRQGNLPPGFEEADIDVSREVANDVPAPQIRMIISRNGQPVNFRYAIPVATPLTMEIEQDLDSAKFYGLKVKEVRVGNNVNGNVQILVKDGCSSNKQVFTSEFVKIDNTHLQATFKAVKFPYSAYVKFSATVEVCFKECSPSTCNGVPGYGRKRRSEMSYNSTSYDVEIEGIVNITDPEHGEVEKWGELLIMKDKEPKITEIAAQLDNSRLGAASSLLPSMNMPSSILISIGLLFLRKF